jgi:hypothetical protein
VLAVGERPSWAKSICSPDSLEKAAIRVTSTLCAFIGGTAQARSGNNVLRCRPRSSASELHFLTVPLAPASLSRKTK